MTATPESWDDVGSLRLQVECMHQKFGINDSELQKLREKIELIDAEGQEHKRERRRIQVCGILISVFVACVFALQVLVIYNSSASRSTQKLVDEVRKSQADDMNASRLNVLLPAPKRSKNKTWSQKKWGKPGKLSKKKLSNSTKRKTMEQKEPQESNEKRELDVVTASNMEASGSWKSIDGRKTDRLGENITSSEATDDKLVLSGGKLLIRSSHAVFYVCFPEGNKEWYVKKYTPVFDEVTRSQTRMVYPFCYIDTTRSLNEVFDEHVKFMVRLLHLRLEQYCDDINQITFIMEKSKNEKLPSNEHPSNPHGEIPSDSSFQNCEGQLMQSPEWFRIESSAFFKRVFPAGHTIQATSIEEFIDDVYSGKLREVRPAKRDL